MKYQTTKYFALLAALMIAVSVSSVKGQKTKKNDKNELIDFITEYKQFYDLLNTEAAPKTIRKCNKLFSDNVIEIVNDHFDKGSAAFRTGEFFIEDCISFFLNNDAVTDKNIEVGGAGATYYGKNNDDYYAWIYKQFQYKYKYQDQVQPKYISQWVVLTIRKEENGVGFKIVAVQKAERPQDIDNDFIADNMDQCLDTKPDALTDMYGCTEEKIVHKQSIGNGYRTNTGQTNAVNNQNNVQETVVYHRKPAKTHHQPSPPSYRFSLELTGGGIAPLAKSFNNQQLLDYKTNTWRDSGSLASTVGYTAGISLQLAMTNWLGAGLAYQYVNLPLATKKLMLQIKSFIGNNGVDYDNVAVKSQAYQIHMVYASVVLGGLKFKKTVWKIEPLIGEAITDLVFPNKLDVQVRYTSGEQQTESLLLKYPAFLVYGAKGTIQWGMGRKGNARFQLQGYFIQGKSDAPSQTIHFTNLPGNIIITAPNLQLAGINAGFHFTLNTPR